MGVRAHANEPMKSEERNCCAPFRQQKPPFLLSSKGANCDSPREAYVAHVAGNIQLSTAYSLGGKGRAPFTINCLYKRRGVVLPYCHAMGEP